MSIYTKTGDKGETGVLGQRVPKSSSLIETIGLVDELNSFLGVCIANTSDNSLKEKLSRVQRNLFTIGSILAGAKLSFPASHTKLLEKEIDELEKILPVIKNFLLPQGSITSSNLQFARSLTRKAERRIVSLSEEKKTKKEILVFVNRLSDYLFCLARFENFKNHIPEVFWKGKRK